VTRRCRAQIAPRSTQGKKKMAIPRIRMIEPASSVL